MLNETTLRCACCGSEAGRWKQWFNQDTGYGVCRKCADQIMSRSRKYHMGPSEFRRTYGVPGIHYEPHHHEMWGRAFVILATFPATREGMRGAQVYMNTHKGTAILANEDGQILIASTKDKGTPIIREGGQSENPNR